MQEMWSQNNQQDTPQLLTKPPISNSPVSSDSAPSLVRPSPRADAANGNHVAAIGKSLVIKGEVSGSESLYIDGRIEGSINLPENSVTIGSNGQVNATVTAREVIVQGKIVGNVNASDRLKVHSEGSLTGDAVAQRISLEDGAFFKGKIDIRGSGQLND
jgi:cytoskeletal protein CcmA (bactofilin family)